MSRLSKAAIIALALLIWYTLFGFLIAPPLIRHFAEKAMQENFSSESSIAKVRLNPFTGSLRVQEFMLKEAEGVWSVALQELELNISGATFYKLYPVVDRLGLEAPDIRFERRLDDSGTAIEQVSSEEVASDWRTIVDDLNLAEIPEFRIDLLEVANGRAEFLDQTAAEPFDKTVDPINFTLRDLTTVVEGDSAMRFVAKTEDGATLTWEGDFRSQPIRSVGRLSLEGLLIHDLSPYYTEWIRFDLERAVFGFSLDYEIDLSNMEKVFSLSSGQVRLEELNCVPSDGSDQLISINSLLVDGVDFEFPGMALNVAKVSVSDGETLVAKGADGLINLTQLFAIPEQNGVLEDEVLTDDLDKEDLPPLSYAIEELSVTNYKVIWQDALEAGRANLEVLVKEMGIVGYTSDTTKPFQINASYQIGGIGSASLDGSIQTDGPVIDLEIDLDELSLQLLSLYGENYGSTQISGGTLDFEGRYLFDANGAHALTGGGAFNAVDLAYDTSLKAKWSSLELTGLDIQFAPFDLNLQSVALKAPDLVYTQARTDDGLASEEESLEALDTSTNEGEESGMPINIARIQIEQGSIRFVDTNFEPTAEQKLNALDFELSGLDLNGDAPSTVTLNAEVNGSPVRVGGEISVNQFRDATQIKASLESLSLPAFSPYSGQAIGRRIANGHLSLDADWTIKDSQLKAANKIVVDQFELGDRVEDGNSINLPIDLAITLLKGPNGVMNLSLPLSGDLSDPKVSIGQIVGAAVVGLITNVASAPFKMLSNIVGSEEDLSIVSFEPGSAQLPPAMLDRLNVLSAALKERPGLNLAITPQLSKEDTMTLSTAKLRLDLMGDSDLSDEELYVKRLTTRFREAMEAAATPDQETRGDSADGLKKMLATLLPGVELTSEDVVTFAAERAAAIQEHLTVAQGIATERLLVNDPAVDAEVSGVRFDLK